MQREDTAGLTIFRSPHAPQPAGARLGKWLWAALGAAAAAGWLSIHCSPRSPKPFAGPAAPPQGNVRIAVVGDLQRTSGLEFWREQNDAERKRVIEHIAEGRPAMVMMLGDLVFDGSSEAEWAVFDDLVAPLRDAKTPCLTVVGNHEHWALGRRNLRRVFERFPLLGGSTSAVVVEQGIALVGLDSNRDDMPAAEWTAQKRWFGAALARLDEDRSIRAVVVAAHHPAFTNSTVTGDEPAVRDELVPILMRSSKTVLVLAGHVHSYEHFVRRGKHFVVSGGGGGPRVELALGAKRRHADDLARLGPIRPFHVLWMEPSDEGIVLVADGLDKGGVSFGPIDRFVIPWPAATSPRAPDRDARPPASGASAETPAPG